jgi:hypothetical protein
VVPAGQHLRCNRPIVGASTVDMWRPAAPVFNAAAKLRPAACAWPAWCTAMLSHACRSSSCWRSLCIAVQHRSGCCRMTVMRRVMEMRRRAGRMPAATMQRSGPGGLAVPQLLPPMLSAVAADPNPAGGWAPTNSSDLAAPRAAEPAGSALNQHHHTHAMLCRAILCCAVCAGWRCW